MREGSDFGTRRQAVVVRLSAVGGGRKVRAPEEPLRGGNVNTLAPLVAMGRHYKNISGRSVTLSSFGGQPRERNRNDECARG